MEGTEAARLLAAAAEGDESAWRALVDGHANLVWAVVNRFGFDDATSRDVFQTVWLRLAEHLHRIRRPESLGGWLARCARNESIGVIRHRSRLVTSDTIGQLDADVTAPEPDADLVRADDVAGVRAGLARLSAKCRELLTLLAVDPPPSYDDVSEALDMPIGSIGPTRGRCLERLRDTPEVQALAPDRGGA